ncbi:MAG TPA: hypothetical protein V6C81_02680 [Planktothrix sp.]|jgi:hypothetical protein
MKQNKPIALFDMDGSLFDYDGKLLADMRLLASPNEPPIVNLWQAEKLPHLRERMRLIKSQTGWWLSLAPIPEGMRVYHEAIKMGFATNIVTKGPRKLANAWKEKVECCQTHFGEDVQMHVTSDKGLFYGKLLYDDFPPYCLAWLEHRPRGLVIMPERDVNRDFHHPQVVKWNGKNWRQVKSAMRKAYLRKENEPLVL